MEGNLVGKILKLKEKRNALILAHYYQPAQIQKIADYVGDSYYLSEIARDAEEKVIVFCGVKFMGESAKILSPEKKILMPYLSAGCSMADMIDADQVKALKDMHPDACVVCYINSTYEVKAYCDVAVTSSSAMKIINNIEEKKIVFVPDKNLGSYIAEFFPEKQFILWDGYCRCHNNIKREDIIEAKKDYKHAKVLVHPECTKEIRDMSDYIGSTSGIINYVSKNESKEFIIGTEEGILYELEKENPHKKFIFPGERICCKDMKKTTLENLYDVLVNMNNEVILNEDIRVKAEKCLQNMHLLNK